MNDQNNHGTNLQPASASGIDYSALKKVKPPDFDSWKENKKQTWLQIDTNPNAFFYRYVLPGETKKSGGWSESEKKLFIQTLKVHPPSSGHWGLFARHIPGRVGYQCNAFYKKLLASGEIEEDKLNEKNYLDNIEKENSFSKLEIYDIIQRPSPPKDPSREYVKYTGHEYAYFSNIRNDFFNESTSDLNEKQYNDLFSNKLSQCLKNRRIKRKFKRFSNFYYK